MLPRLLMTASAAVVLLFGIIHIIYTFSGPKLTPRDPAVLAAMQQGHPVISNETTIWRAWVGFNYSHSLALVLFGLIYGYLALAKSDVLFCSWFLLATGFGLLLAIAVLARLYWFSTPFRGAVFALLCYVASVILSKLVPLRS